MRWVEWCCCCPCRLHRHSPGVMRQGCRAQVASPVLLHSHLASTPLVDDYDDAVDVVIFDTRVEYLPRRTRTRTALDTHPQLNNIKKHLLQSRDLLVPPGDFPQSSESLEDPGDGPGVSALAHNCYEMTVELESPGQEQSASSSSSSSSTAHQPQQERESSVVSVFRALKCIEGQESPPGGARFLPLEVRRPSRPCPRPPPGYSPLSPTITIDY